MAIHSAGYRSWDGQRSSPGIRWAVIASTGVRRTSKSIWLRRMLFISLLPTLFFAVPFFLSEQALRDPNSARQVGNFLSEIANNPAVRPRGALAVYLGKYLVAVVWSAPAACLAATVAEKGDGCLRVLHVLFGGDPVSRAGGRQLAHHSVPSSLSASSLDGMGSTVGARQPSFPSVFWRRICHVALTRPHRYVRRHACLGRVGAALERVYLGG